MPSGCEFGGDHLGGGDGLRVLAGDHHVHGQVLHAGLSQQALGLGQVGGVRRVVVVPLAGLRDGGLVDRRVAEGRGLDDGTAVDGVGDRLPHADVVVGLTRLVQRHVPVVGARHRLHREAVGRLLQRLHLLRRQVVGPLHLAALQVLQRDRRVGDECVLDRRDLRRAAPVVRVGRERDRQAVVPRDHPVRAGADRVLRDLAGRDVLLLHDRDAHEAADIVEEVRRGLLEGDDDLVGAVGRDRFDRGEPVRVGELLVNDPVVGVDDVGRCERRAVLPGGTAQREGPGQLVLLVVQLVARAGSICRLALGSTSVSKTFSSTSKLL